MTPALCWEKPVISHTILATTFLGCGHTDCVALGTEAGAAAAVERGFRGSWERVAGVNTDPTPRHESVNGSVVSDPLQPHGL